MQFPLLDVGDIHRQLAVGEAHVFRLQSGTAKAQLHLVLRQIELAVVKLGQYHILHGVTRCHLRDELAHHQAGETGVAIREVEDVGIVQLGLLLGIERRQIEAAKAGQGTEAGVGAGGGIDADSLKIVGTLLEVGDGTFAQTHLVAQEGGVAVAGDPLILLLAGHAAQVVGLLFMQGQQSGLVGIIEREVTDKLRQRTAIQAIARDVIRHVMARITVHYLVDAKVLFVEIDAAAEPQIRIEGLLETGGQLVDVDLQRLEQTERHRAVDRTR